MEVSKERETGVAVENSACLLPLPEKKKKKSTRGRVSSTRKVSCEALWVCNGHISSHVSRKKKKK